MLWHWQIFIVSKYSLKIYRIILSIQFSYLQYLMNLYWKIFWSLIWLFIRTFRIYQTNKCSFQHFYRYCRWVVLNKTMNERSDWVDEMVLYIVKFIFGEKKRNLNAFNERLFLMSGCKTIISAQKKFQSLL